MGDGAGKGWAVVLAGGEGRRLLALTRALHGRSRPKQLAAIGSDRSLLQATVDRVTQAFDPSRTLVVVTRPQAPLARLQLAPFSGVELLVEPRGLGTAPAALLALARLLVHAPAARVTVFPSDHFVPEPAQLFEALAACGDGASVLPVALHGAGSGRRGPRGVPRVFTGTVSSLWGLARRRLRDHVVAFSSYADAVGRPREAAILEAIYAGLQPADLEADALRPGLDARLVPVAVPAWSDWDEPEDVFASLRGTPEGRDLLRRVAAALETEGRPETGARLVRFPGGRPSPSHRIRRNA